MMYKKVLLTFCFITSILIGIGTYLTRVKEENATYSLQSKLDTVITNSANDTSNKFSEIYKTIYFLSQTTWPEVNIKNKLALEFDKIVNLYPYISGVMVTREDGSYYTSNRISMSGEAIEHEKLKGSFYNKTNWFSYFQENKHSIDLSKQLIGLHVGKLTNERTPLSPKTRKLIAFGKQLTVVIGEPRIYNIFFFVNDSWIKSIVTNTKKNLSLISSNANVFFNSKQDARSSIFSKIKLDQNKVLKKLNWTLTGTLIPSPLIEKTKHVALFLNSLGVLLILVMASIVFISSDSAWAYKVRRQLTKDKTLKIDNLSSDISKIQKRNKGIILNIDKLNEKLLVTKNDINKVLNTSNIDEIQSMLEKMSCETSNQELEGFQDIITSVSTMYNETYSSVTGLKDFSLHTLDQNENTLSKLSCIKEMLEDYRVESLNIGLASESNNTDDLKFLARDLYGLSAKLIDEIGNFERSIKSNNDEFTAHLHQTLKHMEDKLVILPESQETAGVFASELKNVLNHHFCINKKIQAEIKTRKEQEQSKRGSFKKVSTSISQSLEILNKEKKKLEGNEKQLTLIESNIQSIIHNHG